MIIHIEQLNMLSLHVLVKYISLDGDVDTVLDHLSFRSNVETLDQQKQE